MTFVSASMVGIIFISGKFPATKYFKNEIASSFLFDVHLTCP